MSVTLRGDFYHYRFNINGHTFSGSTKTPDKKLAEQVEAVKKAEAVKSLMVKGEKPVTLDQAIKSFLRERKGKGGYGNAEVHLRFFLEHIGNKNQSDILVSDVHEAVTKKAASFAHNTVCVSVAYWNALQNHCIKAGYSHAPKLPTMQTEQTRIRYLSKDEEARLYAAIDPDASYKGRNAINTHQRKENQDLLTCLLHTGARLNEIQKMKWSQVNFTEGTVFIVRSKRSISNYVVMSSKLRRVLEARFAVRENDFVFATKASGRVNTRWIRDAVKRAGINEDLGKVTLHTMRHTHVTRCLRGGMNILEVQKSVGHKALSSTLVYSHVVHSEAASKAAAVMDSYVD